MKMKMKMQMKMQMTMTLTMTETQTETETEAARRLPARPRLIEKGVRLCRWHDDDVNDIAKVTTRTGNFDSG